MSDAEIATLEHWAGSGAPEGDRTRLPSLPAFTDGWQLGKPDWIAQMPEPILLDLSQPSISIVAVEPAMK